MGIESETPHSESIAHERQRVAVRIVAFASRAALDRNLVRQQAVQSGQQEAGEHHYSGCDNRPEIENARAAVDVLWTEEAVGVHTENLAHAAPLRQPDLTVVRDLRPQSPSNT